MKAIQPITVVLYIGAALLTAHPASSEKEDKKVARGLQIAPVAVKTDNTNKDKVGLGSYLVNAAAGCANCHTCPTFVPGRSKGKGKQINATNYMAGGVPFVVPESARSPGTSEIRSPNLTPDEHGLPGGLTFQQFKAALTEGHKPLNEVSTKLSPPDEGYSYEIAVMPWRIYQNFETGDLEAIYEYLKAIPPSKPGTCTGPGGQ